MKPILIAAAFTAAGLGTGPVPLGATELGGTHLVFEKATAMKKVSASLYMPAVDRSAKNDVARNPRRVRCTVGAMGKAGSLPAGGKVILRLRGESRGGSSDWQGSELTEPLDERGEAFFDDDALVALVDEADADGAEPELFAIEFDGGKGRKVTQVTVQCVHERVNG